MSTTTENPFEEVPFKEKSLVRSLNLALYFCLGCWVAAIVCVSARVTWEFPVLLFQAGVWSFVLAMLTNNLVNKQNGNVYSFGQNVGSALVLLLFFDGIVWLVSLFGIFVQEHQTGTQIAIFASLSLPLAFFVLTLMVSIGMENHPRYHQPKLYDWAKATASH